MNVKLPVVEGRRSPQPHAAALSFRVVRRLVAEFCYQFLLHKSLCTWLKAGNWFRVGQRLVAEFCHGQIVIYESESLRVRVLVTSRRRASL